VARPRAGMVAPKILNFYQRDLIDSVGGLLMCPDGIAQGRGRGTPDRQQYDEITDGLVPSGCAALYRRSMLDEIGLLDDEFFAYCEDADLGLRGLWAGWETAVAPRAVIYHKYSATAGTYSAAKMLLVERNHYLLVAKNFPLGPLMLVPFWSLYRFLLMAYALLTGKGKGKSIGEEKAGRLLVAFIKAHVQALLLLPRNLRRRPKVRRLKTGEVSALLRTYRLPLRHMVLNE